MIAPFAVKLEVTPGSSLLAEADLQEERAGRLVFRNAGRFQPVQAQYLKDERQDRGQRGMHMPAARIALADPVADRRRLRDAAPNVGQRASADQQIVVL